MLIYIEAGAYPSNPRDPLITERDFLYLPFLAVGTVLQAVCVVQWEGARKDRLISLTYSLTDNTTDIVLALFSRLRPFMDWKDCDGWEWEVHGGSRVDPVIGKNRVG